VTSRLGLHRKNPLRVTRSCMANARTLEPPPPILTKVENLHNGWIFFTYSYQTTWMKVSKKTRSRHG